MRTPVLTILATLATYAAATLAAETGVAPHSEQGSRAALIVHGSALTEDGRLLTEGDWVMAGEWVVIDEPTIVLTPMSVYFIPPLYRFKASKSPLAFHCAGCACGCGEGIAYFTNPSGELSETYCNSFKHTACVPTGGGGIYEIDYCMPAMVPCDGD